MLNVGDIIAYIKADVSGLEQGISKAKTGTRSLSGYMDSAVGASTRLMAGFAVAGAAVGTAGLFAIKSAGDMEMLRSSLDTLTGSTAAGSKMFQDLYNFAAKTPFETGDLAKATQTMLSFGVSNEKVIPNLKMLGDISMGNKDKLAGLTLAFSQVQSTGRLMGQDLLQMINSGFNPLTIISQKTGKSMATLKDEMEKGKISAGMVADAMKTATSEGGLFYQGMDRGSRTLQGVWSTLMDTTGMMTRKLVGLSETGEIIKGGLVDKVKGGINGLITFLNDNQDKILKWVNDIFGWMKDNFPIIAGIITFALIPAFWGLAAGIWATLAPLLPFIAAGAAIGWVLNEVAKSVGGWDKMLGIVKKTLEDIWKFLEPIFMPVLKALKALWDDLIKVLTDFWNKNKDWLIPTLKILGIIIGTIIVASILAAIGVIMIIIGVVNLLARAISWVADHIRERIDTMKRNWESFKNGVTGVADAIKGAFRGAFNAVARSWNDTVGKVGFKVPNWVPGMGGKEWSIPDIPYLAEGTDYFKGGMAIVGEKGPELVNLPTGSSVTPNSKLGGVNITVNMDGIMARSRADLREIAKDMIGAVNEELRAKGKAEVAI
jgi:tape measure domain-containing protein